jgi:hypothetical protein
MPLCVVDMHRFKRITALTAAYQGRLLFPFGVQIPSDSGYKVNSFFIRVIVDLTGWLRGC